MTREELISLLEANGFNGMPRDWVMGQTVLVSRLRVEMSNGIIALPGATYAWPSGKELVMLDPPGAELRFPTLEAFLRALEEHFRAAEERFRRMEADRAPAESGASVTEAG